MKFNTFQGDSYTGYKRFLKHIVIDTSTVGSDYALREYVEDMYGTYVGGPAEENKHQNEYRKSKELFRDKVLSELNSRVEDYSFSIKNDVKTNLRTDLTLIQNNIGIDNKGKGAQCFIKTEFALKKVERANRKINVALIEEPENHLSHINMKRLIQRISQSDDKQLFIATHSNLISSRLDLRNTILLHTNSFKPVLLEGLPEDTAKYFIKAPDHGVLDFVLSRKVILVEGDSEYMLMESFYKLATGKNLEADSIHVISVGGTSFKRYLDIAKLLGMKVVVIRDNDSDFQNNCIDLY
ncbi:MAG: TOPRIM nucleotidyl transferase/hydrolase domain-containing protein, partial [Nitrospira sp.]